MNLSRAILAFLCAVTLSLPAAAADAPKPFDLYDSLSVAQFHEAGLDKLSRTELVDLNTFASHYAGTRDFDLRDVMTVRQFHQAGLDKLSPDEITALNGAVSRLSAASLAIPAKPPEMAATAPSPAVEGTLAVAPHAAVTTQAPAAVSNGSFGKEMMVQVAADAPDTLTTTLPGRFRGWNGNTVFKLADGQVWVQAGPGMFDTDMQNPTVVIKRLHFGYLLTIPGQVETVFVRRIH